MARERKETKSGKSKTSNVIDVTFEDYSPPTSEYMGEEPRRGVYRFRLTGVGLHETSEGNKSIRWILSCTDTPYEGWAGFMYTGLPGSESFFRTQHNVRALQGGKEKALKLNLDSPEKFIKAAKVVLGRIVMEEYNGDHRAKLRLIAPDDGTVKSTVVRDDEEDDDEGFDDDEEDFEDDSDSDEDEETDDDDDEDEEESDDDDDDDDDDDEEDLDLEDDEDDEEDDDEEEEEPVKPKRSKKSASKPETKKPVKAAPKKSASSKAATKKKSRK